MINVKEPDELLKLTIQIDLSGKTALVTGSGRGIGRDIALAFARAGATLVINDLVEKNCAETCEEIQRLGNEARIALGDISSERDVERIVRSATDGFGKIDILVNNAGVIFRKSVLELTESEWSKTIDVNLKGTFLCSKAAAREMIQRKTGGKIVSISSIMGQVALPPRAAYCASKGGIIALTKDLALELAEHRINVNAVAPGWVETEFTAGYFFEKSVHDYLISRIPAGRFARPSEVAGLVTYLCSDLAEYITGQTIFIDGGWTAI